MKQGPQMAENRPIKSTRKGILVKFTLPLSDYGRLKGECQKANYSSMGLYCKHLVLEAESLPSYRKYRELVKCYHEWEATL